MGYKKKKDLPLRYLHKTHFECKDTHSLKVKGQKTLRRANGNHGKPMLLHLDNIDFKAKTVL